MTSSGAAAVKLRRPEQLRIPPDDRVKEVLQYLTVDGARAFVTELFEAIEDARANGDLSYINYVIESWYRTLLLKAQPGHDERWEAAQRAIAEHPVGLTSEELSQRQSRPA